MFSPTMLCSIIGLNACSGGTGSQNGAASLPNTKVSEISINTANANLATPMPKSVPVTLNYELSAAHASATRAYRQRNISRVAQYISTSNTLLRIAVTPLGGTPSNYGPSACTTASCAVNFSAVPGPAQIDFTLTDASSNVLSQFSTTAFVQPGALNTLNFTANPVVASASLQLSASAVNAGTAADIPLTVVAKDSDNQTIVGNTKYVDVNGEPVTFSVTVSNNQAGGQGTLVVKGPPSINAPGQAALVAHYDGQWMNSATLSVSASSPAISSLTPTTLTTTPGIATTYTIPGAGTSNPTSMTLGPDGNIWFCEDNNFIERMTMSGVFTKYTIPSGASPFGITVGSDGNIWFTECAIFNSGNCGGADNNAIGRVSLGGVVTEFANASGEGIDAGNNVGFIVPRFDGALWFPEAGVSKIASLSTAGVFNELAMPAQAAAMAEGIDGNLWVASRTGSSIWRILRSGALTSFTIPGGGEVGGMVLGTDNNIWFTEQSGGKIGKITPNGSITEYTVPGSGAEPLSIIVGPDDNIWFLDDALNKLGQITSTGTITEYVMPGSPQGLVVGSDGNIWVTLNATNKVAKFVL
jgi:streptogramin lyase